MLHALGQGLSASRSRLATSVSKPRDRVHSRHCRRQPVATHRKHGETDPPVGAAKPEDSDCVKGDLAFHKMWSGHHPGHQGHQLEASLLAQRRLINRPSSGFTAQSGAAPFHEISQLQMIVGPTATTQTEASSWWMPRWPSGSAALPQGISLGRHHIRRAEGPRGAQAGRSRCPPGEPPACRPDRVEMGEQSLLQCDVSPALQTPRLRRP